MGVNPVEVQVLSAAPKKYLTLKYEFDIDNKSCFERIKNAPVAQLDRASDYESEGYRFDSCRAHHITGSSSAW